MSWLILWGVGRFKKIEIVNVRFQEKSVGTFLGTFLEPFLNLFFYLGEGMAKIQVMISSRCNDSLDENSKSKKKKKLASIRQELKKQIEDYEILGEKPFQVWIHEKPPKGQSGGWIWDDCLKYTEKADILIVLYNGNAGFSNQKGGIGICHAELEAGISSGSTKVKIIELPLTSKKDAANKAFQKYYSDLMVFRYKSVSNAEEIEPVVKEAIADTLVELTKLGVRESKKSKYDIGAALVWSKLSYEDRKAKIEKVIQESLKLTDGFDENKNGDIFYIVSKDKIRIKVSAMPSAYSISRAKELTGKPFQKDHNIQGKLSSDFGPVHLIGCFKGFTEGQAISMLGDPDVTIVESSFGIYAYDPIHHVQVVFVTNCRDEVTTKHGVQRFLDWLNQAEEINHLVARSKKRRKVIEVLKDL